MKKLLSVIMAMLLAFSVAAAAFSAYAEEDTLTLEYTVTKEPMQCQPVVDARLIIFLAHLERNGVITSVSTYSGAEYPYADDSFRAYYESAPCSWVYVEEYDLDQNGTMDLRSYTVTLTVEGEEEDFRFYQMTDTCTIKAITLEDEDVTSYLYRSVTFYFPEYQDNLNTFVLSASKNPTPCFAAPAELTDFSLSLLYLQKNFFLNTLLVADGREYSGEDIYTAFENGEITPEDSVLYLDTTNTGTYDLKFFIRKTGGENVIYCQMTEDCIAYHVVYDLTNSNGYNETVHCFDMVTLNFDYSPMKAGWQQEDGSWRYYDSEGFATTGWLKDGGKWYFLDADGVMQTGWIKDSGRWYYLKASGAMATGWQKVNGTWYYLNKSGVMQTGWIKLSGKWYYLNPSGAMRTANLTYKGKVYKFSSAGVCLNP